MQMGRNRKHERGGGARDDSEIYVSYSRVRLLEMIVVREARMGVSCGHEFPVGSKERADICRNCGKNSNE